MWTRPIRETLLRHLLTMNPLDEVDSYLKVSNGGGAISELVTTPIDKECAPSLECLEEAEPDLLGGAVSAKVVTHCSERYTTNQTKPNRHIPSYANSI